MARLIRSSLPERSGHLFGDRFASWLIEEEDHQNAACEYVLWNPVRAGLCERTDDWRWSGAAALRKAGRTYVR